MPFNTNEEWKFLDKILNTNIPIRDLLLNLDDETSKKLSKTEVSYNKKIEDLINAYKNDKLVLVLGAGVSLEQGLPTWNILLQKLLINTFKTETNKDKDKSFVLAKLFTEIFTPSPLIAARYLRNEFSNEINLMQFEEAVRKSIYDELNISKKSKTFEEICQLCAAPGKTPNLNSIITYNFDDLLETYLRNLKIEIPFKSIFKLGDSPTPQELPIYHVHGYLPQKEKLTNDNKITLSEDIYHHQYSDIYSWNNIIQINKFRDEVCLFIGLSFTDPNLRRLLDIAKMQKGKIKRYHYIIRKKYNFSEIKNIITRILDKNEKLLDEKVRANLQLDDSIKYLISVMERFEENDALSFGVRTIWINDFNEIPTILKNIRKMKPNSS